MTQQLRALAALPKDIGSAPSMVGQLPTCCTGFHALFLPPQAPLTCVTDVSQTEAHTYKKKSLKEWHAWPTPLPPRHPDHAFPLPLKNLAFFSVYTMPSVGANSTSVKYTKAKLIKDTRST